MLILNVADELRAEQENANSCEKNRKALEFKVDNVFKNLVQTYTSNIQQKGETYLNTIQSVF